MIASIIIRESTVRQNARSRYAYGLMQINWKAHRKV
jgi:soluble lytic murein transglycosylase-like protein